MHGTLDDHNDLQYQEDVTLLGCVCVDPGFGLSAPGLVPGGDHQTWQPIQVLCGGHVTDKETRFTSLRVRLRHLDEWADLPGFSLTASPGKRLEFAYESEASRSVPVFDCATLRLTADMGVDGPTAVEGRLRRTLWFELDELKPSTLRELDRQIVSPLRALLTLSVGRECLPVAVQVGPWPGYPWLDVVHSGLDLSASQLLTERDMIVTLKDLDLDGVARWLETSERLGPIPHKVAGVIARRGNVVENDFHDLATAAEGLHRRLHPESERFSKTELKKVRNAVKAAVEGFDEDIRTAIREAIGHSNASSYRTRLSELLSDVGACTPGLTGRDPNEWGLQVASYRNRFAHELNQGPLSDEGVGHCVALRESLSWLLTARLLIEAGVTPERLASRISTHGRYTPFIRQAPDLMPEVYGSASADTA